MEKETVLTYLDAYCERAGLAGIWAEPLNATSNLFFIYAALLAAIMLLRTPMVGRKFDLWMLVIFLFAIGVGSGLWHLYANSHTMLMDVIPITLFINLYLVSALRRLFLLSWSKVAFYWLLYFGAGMAAQYTLPPDLLNGTIMYIPTFLTLAIMTLALRARGDGAGQAFLVALLVWTASLTFRTVDMDICEIFPWGTHFLWHALNAWVLWRLLKVLIARG